MKLLRSLTIINKERIMQCFTIKTFEWNFWLLPIQTIGLQCIVTIEKSELTKYIVLSNSLIISSNHQL